MLNHVYDMAGRVEVRNNLGVTFLFKATEMKFHDRDYRK